VDLRDGAEHIEDLLEGEVAADLMGALCGGQEWLASGDGPGPAGGEDRIARIAAGEQLRNDEPLARDEGEKHAQPPHERRTRRLRTDRAGGRAAGVDLIDVQGLEQITEGYGRSYLLAARAGQVFTDLYDLGVTLMKFTVEDVASQITTPTLVTAYQGDTLVVPPSGQGTKLYQLLTSRKQFHQFTAAEGASLHCAPMAPQTRNQAVYDWLDTIV
jgi:hypothetical protein